MGCHWNVMTLDVIFWHLFWSKKTSKFDGNVMTFWWNSTGFLWGKGVPIKCHENVMKFQCHSMGLKILVHFDGIFMGKVHGIVMEFDVIFDQNSDGNQWWHFIMRVGIIFEIGNWTINYWLPCKKYDTDFLMSFWRQLCPKWLQIWMTLEFHDILMAFYGDVFFS